MAWRFIDYAVMNFSTFSTVFLSRFWNFIYFWRFVLLFFFRIHKTSKSGMRVMKIHLWKKMGQFHDFCWYFSWVLWIWGTRTNIELGKNENRSKKRENQMHNIFCVNENITSQLGSVKAAFPRKSWDIELENDLFRLLLLEIAVKRVWDKRIGK